MVENAEDITCFFCFFFPPSFHFRPTPVSIFLYYWFLFVSVSLSQWLLLSLFSATDYVFYLFVLFFFNCWFLSPFLSPTHTLNTHTRPPSTSTDSMTSPVPFLWCTHTYIHIQYIHTPYTTHPGTYTYAFLYNPHFKQGVNIYYLFIVSQLIDSANFLTHRSLWVTRDSSAFTDDIYSFSFFTQSPCSSAVFPIILYVQTATSPTQQNQDDTILENPSSETDRNNSSRCYRVKRRSATLTASIYILIRNQRPERRLVM